MDRTSTLLEYLGRLARVKESVRVAQLEINEALRIVAAASCVERENLDLSACVATALVNTDAAVIDLETLGKIFKPL